MTLHRLLMIGTIIVASVFNNTVSLGNAYGVCVMFVTFFDTTLVSLVALFVWKIPPYFVFLPWLIIALMDGSFLSSALVKVPDGAWVTLLLAAVLACIFLLWRYGKEQQWSAESSHRLPTSHFVVSDSDSANGTSRLRLADRYHGTPLGTVRGLAVYFDKAGATTPTVFSQFVLKLATLPQVSVFLHLRPLERPHVGPEERYAVSRLAVPHCYRVVMRYGFNDEIITPDLGALVHEQVRRFVERLMAPPEQLDADVDDTNAHDPNSDETNRSHSRHITHPTITHELSMLDAARAHDVLYVVGKASMRVRRGTGVVRAVLLTAYLWLREGTRNKIANLRVPVDRVVEIGYLFEI